MKYILLLILTSIFISCDNKDDVDSFINVDVTEFNKKITSGLSKQEAWVETPILIINNLIELGYDSVGHGTYTIEQYQKDNLLTVIVTQEGIQDDSVFGEKRIIDFKYSSGSWTIVRIRRGVKCCEGRGGHSNYSGGECP